MTIVRARDNVHFNGRHLAFVIFTEFHAIETYQVFIDWSQYAVVNFLTIQCLKKYSNFGQTPEHPFERLESDSINLEDHVALDHPPNFGSNRQDSFGKALFYEMSTHRRTNGCPYGLPNLFINMEFASELQF